MELLTLVTTAFEEGGVFMYPILLCLIFGAALSLERAVYLFFRAGIHAPSFAARLQQHLLEGQVEQALRYCAAEAGAALPQVLRAGVARHDRPDAEIRDALEEATLEVSPQISQRLPYLSTLANTATLLGLLGTIQGLIGSFHAVGTATAAERAQALSQGIAVAMYTTFFGLLVAIPLVVVHSVLAARANRILDDLDHQSMKLVNLLSALRARASS